MLKYLLILATVILFIGCKTRKHAETKNDTYYTCSMHPQVVQDNPGKCPICQMELIAVNKIKTSLPDELILSDQQMELGNVHVDTIGKSAFGTERVLPGTVVADETKANTISSRIAGRVDKLYYKNTGDYIRKGVAIMEVYSEELNNQKQQYLMLLEKQKTLGNTMINFSELLQSARIKLSLWGLTESQIKIIERTRHSTNTTSVFSNVSGYITSLDIPEGSYVTAGSPIVHLTNLSSLWVEVQLYASELNGIDHGQKALITFPDLPGKEIKATIDFTSPEIQAQTRTNIARLNIPNSDNLLKPGMAASVILNSKSGMAITLPADAVIQDTQGASVWIKTGDNAFKKKMVEIGSTSNDRIEIKSGLSQGDVVVTTGAYLINSEYVFKKGAAPMAGMKMDHD